MKKKMFIFIMGFLTILLAGFSQIFAEQQELSAVASVNGTNYLSLQDAIDNADTADRIELLTDVSESIVINKPLTIDLGTHQLSGSSNQQVTITIADASKVMIHNGQIIASVSNKLDEAAAIKIKNTAFTLKDLEINGATGLGYVVNIGNYQENLGESLIENVTIQDNKTNMIRSTSYDPITIKNSLFQNNIATNPNMAFSLGGRGSYLFESSIISGNSSQGMIDGACRINGSQLTNNTVSTGAIIHGGTDQDIVIYDSVVKDNTATDERGVAGVDAAGLFELIIKNSAIYHNTNTQENGWCDFGKGLQSFVTTGMKDPFDASVDFSNSALSSRGEVIISKPIYQAQINNQKYVTLSQAILNAKESDIIKIINTDAEGNKADLHLGDGVAIWKKVTIDLNGYHVKGNPGKWLIYLWPAPYNTDVSFINTADEVASLNGSIYNKGASSKLTIGDNIDVTGFLYPNDTTLICGTHHALNLQLNFTNQKLDHTIQFADDFSYVGENESFVINLNGLSEVNELDSKLDEIVLLENVPANLAEKVKLHKVTNPYVSLVVENGQLILRKTSVKTIVINPNDSDRDPDTYHTFAAAKEQAQQLVKENTSEKVVIFVANTIDFTKKAATKTNSEAITIGFDEEYADRIILQRDQEMTAPLMKVKGNQHLILKNITIDGTSQQTDTDSLIQVEQGGQLTLEEGVILQNNQATKTTSTGGAITLNNAKLMMNDGKLSGNSAIWGGAIFATNNSQVTINGGTITNNHAVQGSDAKDKACGGAIALWQDSSCTMSGGVISNNDSLYYGGGIAVGTNIALPDATKPIEFTMTGGTISQNTAKNCGGGIFIQGGLKGTVGYGKAIISGGTLTGNRAEIGQFGGGAIYVNGGSKFRSAELHLTNALISENKAGIEGGGYAACPTSQTFFMLKDGAVFYQNEAPVAHELYIDAETLWQGVGGNPTYQITPLALGGIPYHWHYDSENNQAEVPLDQLSGTLSKNIYFTNPLTKKDIIKAEKLAQVTIKNNYAQKRGGAIGSNGDVYIGTGETIDIKVTKKWLDQDASLRPESIKIAIYRATKSDSQPVYLGYQVVTPDEAGNWVISFTNLPKTAHNGEEYIYTVKEMDSLDYYEATIEGDMEDGFTITNRYQPTSTNLKVEKVWKGDTHLDVRPTEITVKLLADGKVVQSVILNNANNWQHIFENLPRKVDEKLITYTVEEVKIPGYQVEITQNGTTFTITNTKETTPPKPIIEKRTIPVEKIWQDSKGQLLSKEELKDLAITVRLLADGKDTGKILILNSANNWQASFDNLLAKSLLDGHEINYTIEEVQIDGFTGQITGSMENGFVLINSKDKPDKPEQPDKPIEPDKPDKPTEPDKPDKPTVPDTGQPEQPEQPVKPTEPNLPITGTKSSAKTLIVALILIGIGSWLIKKRKEQ